MKGKQSVKDSTDGSEGKTQGHFTTQPNPKLDKGNWFSLRRSKETKWPETKLPKKRDVKEENQSNSGNGKRKHPSTPNSGVSTKEDKLFKYTDPDMEIQDLMATIQALSITIATKRNSEAASMVPWKIQKDIDNAEKLKRLVEWEEKNQICMNKQGNLERIQKLLTKQMKTSKKIEKILKNLEQEPDEDTDEDKPQEPEPQELAMADMDEEE